MSIEPREPAVSQATEAIAARAHQVAARIKESVEPLREQLSSAYEAAQHKSAEALTDLEEQIRRAPFKTLAYTAGIAAVIAIVGSVLASRKSNRHSAAAGD